MTLKIVLAGFGVMGRHYADKLARHGQEWGVEIAALVDTRPESFDLLSMDPQKFNLPVLTDLLQRTPQYSDIGAALADHNPDILINTTNNQAHIEMIRALELCPAAQAFLTEKPLVNQTSEEAEAEIRLRDHFVSMNMVTNFSAAAAALRTWIAENPQLKLIGIDAVWGKDRRDDLRPTPGIANDIVHPVGLVQSVFGAQDWVLQNVQGLYGTLSTSRDGQSVECAYHFTMDFTTNAASVRMDTSFAWLDQARRVTGFFQDTDGSYKVAELFLDEANAQGSGKRADFFRIYDVPADVSDARLSYESPLATEDKIARFLQLSIAAYKSGAPAAEYGLVGLAEEREIGKIYGVLYPCTDKAGLLADPHLHVKEFDPAQSPKVPLFSRLDQVSLVELKSRIESFKPASAAPSGPASRPAPAP